MWFRYALSISTPRKGAMYTAIDPGEFYEWRFMGFIPEGRVFTEKLPPSQIFTDGLVIASAVIPPNCLRKTSFGYETSSRVDADVELEVGQIQTPREILSKLELLQTKFAQGVIDFKKASPTRMFFITPGKHGHLYRVSSISDNSVALDNYGEVSEVRDLLVAKQKDLQEFASQKLGRAHELEKVRQFENAMTFVQNGGLPLDANKIKTLITIAELTPKSTNQIKWEDCCAQLSPEMRQYKDLIDRYHSLQWVKNSLQFSKEI